LDNDPHSPTPPWAHIRELQQSAEAFEDNENPADEKKWLDLLIAPGSSLGGARPKANILDQNNWEHVLIRPSCFLEIKTNLKRIFFRQ
jgi:serine/threonine-protein kinase HipA